MKKILIAGSDGFIGSHLTRGLASEYDVYGIGNYKGFENNFSHVDLTDLKSTEEFVNHFHQFDTLVFLVALAHSKGKNKDYSAFRNINVQTLINLVYSLQKYNKLPRKIIFSSTISVYGENWRQNEYPETTPLQGKTPYARTKIEAEKYLLENFADRSLILRFAPVYADDFNLNIDRRTKFKNSFFRINDGLRQLSLLNIKNIITAVQHICEEKAPADIYNLSDERIYTYTDLLEYQHTQKQIKIPKLVIKSVWLAGKLFKNNFLIENSVKLATNNIYPSTKLQEFFPLNGTLND